MAEHEIEMLLRERTGRECLFVPSGRIGLYMAFRAWLKPRARILMSPVNDDVIFFTVLAAGLRPVMAPVSLTDGNIDVAVVPDNTWASVDAVLTTNLYGIADQMIELHRRCQVLGIPLIEDAAHAIETEVDGRPIGTFGAVSSFSFSKHVGGVGGVASFAEAARRDELARLLQAMVGPPSLRNRLERLLRPETKLGPPVRRVARAVGLNPPARKGWRMPLRPGHLSEALAAGPDLDHFERWVRVDRADYRKHQGAKGLKRTAERLRRLPEDRRRRVKGLELLRRTQPVAAAAAGSEPLALLRVPLLVEDRDAVAKQLQERGITVFYVYDPPLDDYAGPKFCEPSPAPEAARWWAGHVLPVDPLEAERVLAALQDIKPRPAI